jgi:hypothetical protein
MKKIIHVIFSIIAFVFFPFLWLGFILGGVYTPFLELLREFITHFKSNEPWGLFDA